MTLTLWWQGARPRTLGAAVAPVLVGTAVASRTAAVLPGRAVLALTVALALQVGVNYANDYSDGVRGVDEVRRGPVRLTAAGLASPAAVKRAALASLAVAAAAGIALAVAVDLRLLVVGAAAIAAAGAYSGGPRPYASAGLGEVFVLVFFGFVATVGSAYVQIERVSALAVVAAIPVGLLACAILLVNNLRDIDSDSLAGKRTLAVRIGAARTRRLYRFIVLASLATVVVMAPAAPGSLLALAAAPLAFRALRAVAGSQTQELVVCLLATARLQQVLSVLLAVGLVIAP